jgi:hypothetical protein
MALSTFTKWWNQRQAYRQTFERGDWIDAEGQPTVHARRVLATLKEFCRYSETCVVIGKNGQYDTHATAVAEGRREVLLLIQHTLGLTDEQLFRLRNPDEE